MTSTRKPPVPGGLGPSGQALWRAVVAVFELDPHELVTLESASRQRDVVAQLEAVVDAEGPMVEGSKGQSRVHPAVTEARQGRIALATLLGRIDLQDVDGRSATTPSQRGRRAANARWARELREVG